MKKIIILFSGSLLVLLSACTKVIDIDLNSKDPRIVIEGNITDVPGRYAVNITQTVNFSETNSFPAVSGAVVTVADDAGNTESLVEVYPGNYQGTVIQGVPGRTYYLTVVANGKTYTSQSKMPLTVQYDSLLLVPNTAFGPAYYIIPLFTDPAGLGNRYRCIETINTTQVKELFLFEDQLTDGLMNGQPILNFSDSLLTGDSVSVELQCIDKPTYLYFFSLLQTVSGQSGAPANPVSNISNDALGYFSAHTSQRKYVIIP
ncbi:MAG: DUF4249 domain-containing protein [Bacteroidia bacterium]